MKGTIVILGCLFAAYAAPLLGNEVPLILEETIVLPVVPEAWDVMPIADSNYTWALAASQGIEFKSLWTSCTEDCTLFEQLDQYDDEERTSLYLYNREGIGPCVGLAIQSNSSDPILWMTEVSCDRSIQDVYYDCRWNGGLCQAGPPPGLRIFCYPELTHASPFPPSPSEAQVLQWYVNERECVRDNIGGTSYTDCNDYLYLSNRIDGWECLTDKLLGARVMCDYQDNSGRIFGYYWRSSWSHGMNQGESFGVGLGRHDGDTTVTTIDVTGESSVLACTRDSLSGQGVLIASFSSGTNAWHEENFPDTLWHVPSVYRTLLCANIAWTENEEILGLRLNSLTLDIYDLISGTLWGQTTSLDSGYAEMKIIGRYHNETRRLVVRYGNELRIYRFGDPIYTDADDARPELPNELVLSAYPNPFNPTTTIGFELPKAGQANLTIFDLNGRLVKTIFDEQMSAGSHEFGFDGANLPSGIYFARLTAGELVRTQKLVLLK